MNLGYYFDVPGRFVSRSSAAVPAWLGLFAAELARQAGELTLYIHDAPLNGTEGFVLAEPNMRCVNLGPRRSAPARTLRPGPALRTFRPSHDGVDVMLIRGPTELLPHLARKSGVPTALYLVGDLMALPLGRANPAWRNGLIHLWRRLYTRQQAAATAGRLVIVNSPALAQTFDQRRARIEFLVTSVVGANVFDEYPPHSRDFAASKGRTEPLRLLFVGRLDEEKGVFDAIQAVQRLEVRGYDVQLDLVGRTDSDKVRQDLDRSATTLGVQDRVSFHGFVDVGPRLWRIYREADILLLPSKGEGFPHTVVEAMAASLPVFATRVGGIPSFLSDGEHALLVEPGSVDALVDGVVRLIDHPGLRSELSRRGWEWGREHTLERSCADMIRHLERWLGETRTTVGQRAPE